MADAIYDLKQLQQSRTSLSIMAETFHYFLRLPTEIRQEIWGLAVRDVKARGAHYLVFRPYLKHESIEDCAVLTFTAPQCGRRCKTKTYPLVTLSGYWEHANPSTYLRDSGMWAACKESRQMMQRKFYPRENTQLYCLDDEYCRYLYIREEEPFTGLFYDACLTTPRWLAVFPGSDVLSCE